MVEGRRSSGDSLCDSGREGKARALKRRSTELKRVRLAGGGRTQLQRQQQRAPTDGRRDGWVVPKAWCGRRARVRQGSLH